MASTDQLFQQAFRAHQAGDIAAATSGYKRVLQKVPRDPEVLYLLGTAYGQSGEYEEAKKYLDQALHLNPKHVETLNNLGLVLKALREPRDALVHYRRAIERRPDYADAHNNAGNALELLGELDEAEQYLRRTLELAPDHVDAHCNLGVVLFRKDRFAEAAAHLRRGLEARPEHAVSWNYLGSIYKTWGRLELALECLQKAVALDPSDYAAACNHGAVLDELGQCEKALAEYQRAAAMAPDDPAPAWNQAFLYLKQGIFDRGWEAHDLRLGIKGVVALRFPFPLWDGAPLDGKTVLMSAEQGLGDEIMFASCVPDMLERAGHCILECALRLEALFRRSFPGATVVGSPRMEVGWLLNVPRVDVTVPVGTLPRYLRPSLDSFPQRAGYLIADPVRTAHWRERLAALGPGLKIGIAWRSGLTTGDRHKYYSELTQWGDILKTPGVHFVNLQYGDCADELRAAEDKFGVPIKVFEDLDLRDDIDDSAALMSSLDLVIGAGTASLQLAGALGVDAIWLNSCEQPWTLFGRTDRDPWHPRTRYIAQTTQGDWETPLAMVAQAVAEKAAGQARAVSYIRMDCGVEVAVEPSLEDLSRYVLEEQGKWFEPEFDFLLGMTGPSLRMVDAGAGVGAYALALGHAAPRGRVHAITESSVETNLLARSIARNGLRNSVDVAIANAESTLDAHMNRHGLEQVDLLRLSGSMCTAAWLDGGAQFFAANSPLVMFAIGSGQAFDAEVARWMQEHGFGLYRLVPGIGVLAPFTSTDEIDVFSLNLFACKPDRAAYLAAHGALVHEVPALAGLPGIEQQQWRDHLATLPYAAPLLAGWNDTQGWDKDWEIYWMALNLYGLAKTSTEAGYRYAFLQVAEGVLSSLVQEQPNLPRLLSLCRMTNDLGKRELTVTLLNHVCDLLDAGLSTALSEPFLVLDQRFQSSDFSAEPVRRMVAMVLEQREDLRGFSTWFTGQEAMPVLDEVERFGCASAQARRRLALIRARFGAH
jgi:tetratricopeptide (TPR) repeat protein/precorrin-6B methylase 2